MLSRLQRLDACVIVCSCSEVPELGTALAGGATAINARPRRSGFRSFQKYIYKCDWGDETSRAKRQALPCE